MAKRKTNITFRIDKELADQFRNYCEEKGYIMSRAVELFMVEFMGGEWNKKENAE